MADQLTIRINVDDGIAVVSGVTVAEKGGVTIQNDASGRMTARNRILGVAAVAGSQVLAFPAAAQRLSTACTKCGEECGNPIFYPEDGSCPNPIFYPESMIAIGGALLLGAALGYTWGKRSRNQPGP